MEPVVMTPVYAALLSLLCLYLSARVITFRRTNRVSLGDNNNPDLRQRIRAQGNCMEYSPIGLFLVLLLELGGLPDWAVHASGLTLLIGRVLHAAGFLTHPMNFQLRTIGMGLTLVQIGTTALVLLGASIV